MDQFPPQAHCWRKPKLIRTLLLSLVVAFGATGASAATLNVDGSGKLLGAFNVDVGGQSYDVQFLDGTCIDLFSGCDESSDFTFQTPAAASAASQALLNQVFLNDALGAFDSDPSLTFGCSSSVSCFVPTPYGLGFGYLVTTDRASNFSGATVDTRAATLYDPTLSTANASGLVYAIWTPATVVPEPGTGLLVAAGLAVLSARRRSVAGR